MKLIAIDLDGTLLNSSHKISDTDIETIRKVQALGIKVCIATGRTFFDAKRLLQENNLTVSYIISSNGTIIQNFEGNLLYDFPVSREAFTRVLSFLYFNNYYFSASTKNSRVAILNAKERFIADFYASKALDPSLSEDVFNTTLHMFFDSNSESRMEMSFNDFLNIKDDIYCICSVSHNDNKLKAGLAALKDIDGLSIFKSAKNNFEITNCLSSKGQAVQILAKDLDINISEVMAIGDNENDLSMISCSGIGVSMGNAGNYIKDHSNFTTLDNNSSGVSHAINHYLSMLV